MGIQIFSSLSLSRARETKSSVGKNFFTAWIGCKARFLGHDKLKRLYFFFFLRCIIQVRKIYRVSILFYDETFLFEISIVNRVSFPNIYLLSISFLTPLHFYRMQIPPNYPQPEQSNKRLIRIDQNSFEFSYTENIIFVSLFSRSKIPNDLFQFSVICILQITVRGFSSPLLIKIHVHACWDRAWSGKQGAMRLVNRNRKGSDRGGRGRATTGCPEPGHQSL